ncbi:MAG: SUMF1/EgtB/PvdO family nonheme iron enzyme [Polyangiaceae bacterium]|jgi:formylglycine-generating enzyme required for sulfatase activity|nr:SUMF1/EgtB/PvdO family nonheme iron enzyme [Polyangiaceae bacterium]
MTLVWAKVPFPPVAGQPVSASNLDKNFTYLEDLISGKAPCPVDYIHDGTQTAFTLCIKGADEIVKVGQGPSSFWIDRYEASVWSGQDGSGTQYGLNTSASFPGVEKNGEWSDAPLFAVSKKGVEPSRNMTWFQAAAFCRASGKRLPGGEEWLAAGMGVASKDPGASDGSKGTCTTQSDSPRNTGGGFACSSRWGAEDMIGNLWEWTSEWYATLGGMQNQAGIGGEWLEQPWPAGYKAGTWNIASAAYGTQPNGKQPGLPAAGLRGGNWDAGASAGLFAILLNSAPSYWNSYYGFRCLLGR